MYAGTTHLYNEGYLSFVHMAEWQVRPDTFPYTNTLLTWGDRNATSPVTYPLRLE